MYGGIKEEGWHAIDLHVHTPASRDYKGNKDYDEYKEICKKAIGESIYERDADKITEKELDKLTDKERDTSSAKDKERQLPLKLIAVTDHHSVDGFKTIIKLKKETTDLINTLKSRYPDREVLRDLQEEENVFNSIHVLMGTEIKTYPGIHILIVFHESVMPDQVEEFLNCGFDGRLSEFMGDPEPSLKWKITEAFDEIEKRFKNKAFVIAPHVDSSSGIWEGLKSLPQARIEAFVHPVLKAISFNNIENRDRINSMLSSKEYRRKSPLAFIQSSDYHGQKGYEIGFMHTKIKFDSRKINYNSVVELMSNASNVKCSADTVLDIYNKLTKETRVERFTSCVDNKMLINASDYDRFSSYICAFLNSDGGIIEITCNANKEIDKAILVTEYEDDIKKVLADRLKPQLTFYALTVIQKSNSKYIMLLKIRRSNNLHMSGEKVVILKNDLASFASTHDIEYIVARNIRNKYGNRVRSNLNELSIEGKRLAETQLAHPIIIKTEPMLESNLYKYINIEYLRANEPIEEVEELSDRYPNGIPEGNLEVSITENKPRLDYSHLRFTVPTYNIDTKILEDEKYTSHHKESGLIIIPFGGVYIVNENKHIHAAQPTTLITKKEDKLDLYYLTAWFKSSFFIWYCLTIMGTYDLYRIIRRRDRRVLIPNESVYNNTKNDINRHLNNIIIEENKFLKECIKYKDKKEDSKVLTHATEKHNLIVDSINYEIDIIFFKELGMYGSHAKVIYRALKSLNVYDFGVYDSALNENKERVEKLNCLEK